MSARGTAASRLAERAAERVWSEIDEVLALVEARLRAGLVGAPEVVRAEFLARVTKIVDELGWARVVRAAREAVDEIQEDHAAVSDEAFSEMVAMVSQALGDLAAASGDVVRRLVRDAAADLARGVLPTDVAEDLARAARAELLAVGTDFATVLMGLHREGSLGEMEVGGLDLLVYDGPDDEVNRPFCADLVGKVTTEQDLDEMDNGQGLRPTSRYMGGYNCRHVPSPITAEEALEYGVRNIVGRRARAIVLHGASGPNETAFEVEHFGEVGVGGGIIRRRRR